MFAYARLRRSQLTAAPTVSAITAPRAPSGFSWPTVKSRAVWCSTSELSSAPTSTTMVESHIHIMMFGGAVHSFCDPTADAGPTRYDEKLCRKSYMLMRDFIYESL